MKKLLLLIVFTVLSFCGFSQKHYYSTDDSLIYNVYGVQEQYIFPAEYNVYYLNESQDTFKLLTTQYASILVNDEFGYFQLIFFYDFDVIEVYEWEYKKIDWKDDKMQLVSKDLFGVELAVLSLWDDEEYSYVALLTSDKKTKDKLLYLTKIYNMPIY